jgi:hypothetical protein
VPLKDFEMAVLPGKSTLVAAERRFKRMEPRHHRMQPHIRPSSLFAPGGEEVASLRAGHFVA